MENQDLAELFLINFIQNIAITKRPSIQEIIEEEIEPSIIQPERKEKIIRMVKPTLVPIQITKTQPSEVKMQNIFKAPLAQNLQRATSQPSQLISNTSKLDNLIRDPSVNEIECMGADIPLLVKKRGLTQKTPVALSVEEIYELIAEFSQKTRIPVLKGSIKAALNNLIITAVLSENLGPRFILQKKGQSQQLRYG